MAEGGGGMDRDAECSSTTENPDLYCLPCSRAEGQKEDAVGYCRDYTEHLCKICYKVHCRNKHTAHHVLLDQQHVSRSMGTNTHRPRATSNVPCTKHANKFIEYFCSDHEIVLCSVCSTLDHRQCNTGYIPDYAASYLNSKDGKSKLTRIQDILLGCDQVKKETQEQLQDAETNALQAIEDLDLQRNEIVAAIEKEFEVLKDTAVKFRNERRNKTTVMMKKCDTIQAAASRIESSVENIKSDKSKSDELSLQPMQSNINLDIYETKIKELENTELTSEIRFYPNVYMVDKAKAENILGTMSVGSLSNNTKATKIREVSVKATVNKDCGIICGIEALSDNILALTDWRNKSIKTVNISSGKILNVQQLSFYPFDLTVVPDNKVAVTLSNNSAIQFLSTVGGLALGDKIPCKAFPRGIEYHKGQLVVSFSNPTNKVEILSLTGDVVRSFSPSLNNPLYVTVSNDSHILISDCLNDRVLRVDWTGRDSGTYTDVDLSYSGGIAVCDDGKFLICSGNTNTVHLVSENCKKVTTLLTEKDGMKEPMACCYENRRGLLYVSFSSGRDQVDSIGVYQLM